MELAGHECVGFCEFDKYATASYISMHLATDEQIKYLITLPLRQRQKEILKEEYRNGEWYVDDVKRVCVKNIPRAECWCFGFPCNDISVAGKRVGLTGGYRSSLFFTITELIRNLPETDRPIYLFIENVKNLLNINGGWDFFKVLAELDEIGYDAEWQVLNSKDFGVPQNRERVFIIGHLRGYGTKQVFPIQGANGENRVSTIGHRVGYRKNLLTFTPDGISECLDTAEGGGRGYNVALPCFVDLTRGGIVETPCSRALNARYQKGAGNRKAQDSGVIIPVNNVALNINHEPGIYVQHPDGTSVYAVWYEKYQTYIAIRKLTPREYFRLQGWTDDYFNKAQFFNSDSQLYKQAGNGVTVNVIRAIAEKIV